MVPHWTFPAVSIIITPYNIQCKFLATYRMRSLKKLVESVLFSVHLIPSKTRFPNIVLYRNDICWFFYLKQANNIENNQNVHGLFDIIRNNPHLSFIVIKLINNSEMF